MERKNFKNWLPFETNWHEVKRQFNIAGDYKNEQDLLAVFFTAYKDIELKFIEYFNEFGIIPFNVFEDLIFKFRQSFPKSGRIEDINYYDDLLEMLISKTMKGRKFDLNTTLKNANKIDSIDDRILFLKKEIKEFRQSHENLFIDIDNYEEKVKDEISYLKDEKKSNKTSIPGKRLNPIWWQGSGRLLGYLIEELSKKGFIDKNTDINKVIKDHFINRDKNPFPDSIKQNRSGSGINKNSKPKGNNDIDNILSNLKE